MAEDKRSIVLMNMVSEWPFPVSMEESKMLYKMLMDAVAWAERSNYTPEEWKKIQKIKEKEEQERKEEEERERKRKQREAILMRVKR